MGSAICFCWYSFQYDDVSPYIFSFGIFTFLSTYKNNKQLFWGANYAHSNA